MKSVVQRVSALILAAAAAAGLGAGVASAQQKEIVFGLQCDRTGATQTVGVVLCPAQHDYGALVNSKGGIEGYKVRFLEIDHEYKVPQGMEAYERHKKEGAVSILLYGTPHTQALTQKLTEDKIPGTSPGFGTAAAADGAKFPYIFPIAASYWSQATASIKFIRDKFGGNMRGKKIAYLFYDNPAGREPLPVFEELAKIEGFEMKTFAVPPPGVEMGAQILDITQRFRADFVISHLFGRSPSVSLKELKRSGYPVSKMIGFVWASSEADIEAAGGWAVAEGYYTIQFAGVGTDYPVLKEIVDMYKAQGKAPPKEMQSSVLYNRGLMTAALHVEAARRALKAKGGQMINGEDMKKAFETLSDFKGLGDLAPPLEITPADHEGGGWVQVFQVKGGKLLKATDWYRSYPEVLAKAIKEHGGKS
jgi:branched-chain amino acid transport system substrate-binding protein